MPLTLLTLLKVRFCCPWIPAKAGMTDNVNTP